MPDDTAAQSITDPVGIPLRTRQQVLHPVWRPVTSVPGYRPAVLARQLRQQA
jgi:hypothetical protein